MINLLFVCSRNQWRSPTADKIFRQKGFSTRSAGTSPNARNSISISDVKWADITFVMEKKYKNRIIAKFTRLVEYKVIHILDIPDDYKFMDSELISHLEDAVKPFLDQH